MRLPKIVAFGAIAAAAAIMALAALAARRSKQARDLRDAVVELAIAVVERDSSRVVARASATYAGRATDLHAQNPRVFAAAVRAGSPENIRRNGDTVTISLPIVYDGKPDWLAARLVRVGGTWRVDHVEVMSGF